MSMTSSLISEITVWNSGMVFEDGVRALYHALDREAELASIIRVSEECLECLDELIEGGELGGQCVFRYEPEFQCADKEECCRFHFLFFVSGHSDVRMNLEDPGIDDSKGRVFSREEWGLSLFQHRGHHSVRRRSPGNGCCAEGCLSS